LTSERLNNGRYKTGTPEGTSTQVGIRKMERRGRRVTLFILGNRKGRNEIEERLRMLSSGS